tara:strand:- start:14 stop:484 length:471 start_codon:yes stop_codon:yes gene_type:complete
MTMNYYFTGILVILLALLTLCVKPANARNEYLNNGSNTCRSGELSASIEKEDRDGHYNHYNNTNNYDNEDENYRFRIEIRKYLGVKRKDCETRNDIALQNEKLKQQIELYKVCKSVRQSKDPLPQFAELLAYCNGTKAYEQKERINPYKEMIEKIK